MPSLDLPKPSHFGPSEKKSDEWSGGFVALVVIGVLCGVLLIFAFFNSIMESQEHRPSYLPIGAENVHDEGNGWTTFEWQGRRFLHGLHSPASNLRTETITELSR